MLKPTSLKTRTELWQYLLESINQKFNRLELKMAPHLPIGQLQLRMPDYHGFRVEKDKHE